MTVSLGTALGTFGNVGLAAAIAFLISLGVNLVSYATAQRDMRIRLTDIQAKRESGVWGNSWTKATTVLNVVAGIAFLVGGGLLAGYVATAS